MKKTQHLIMISPDLWAKFKAHCALNGHTMSNKLALMILNELQQKEKKTCPSNT